MSTLEQKLGKKDFVSDQDVRWCPGCGDYAVLSQVQKVLPELGVARENFVFISCIGCSSRFPYYVNTYGFHSIHGRAPAIATGLKATRPELSVWVVTGDGDVDHPFDPIALALGAEASFVARSVDVETKHLQEIVRRAYEHKGAAFVEILQNCNVFNDGAFADVTEKATKADSTLVLEHGKPLLFGKNHDKGIRLRDFQPEVVQLGDGITEADLLVHDERNPALAYLIARLGPPRFPTPIGVFTAVERPRYEDTLNQQVAAAKAKAPADLGALLNRGDTWVVS